jgi:putative transposase
MPKTSSPQKKPSVIYVEKGATVVHGGREYTVLRVVDLNLVLAREPSSGEKVLLQIGTLEQPSRTPPAGSSSQHETDLEAVADDDWDEAERRLKVLEPLLAPRSTRSKADYKLAANAAAVEVATLYRWMKAYTATGLLSSLLPMRHPGGRGQSRLNPEVKLILDHYVQTQHLSMQRPSVAKSAREIRRLCDAAGLNPLPAISTIHRHLSWLDNEERIKRREGAAKARQKFAVNKHAIPDATWPLAIVQMDHTLLPVIIVDDEHRKPINLFSSVTR